LMVIDEKLAGLESRPVTVKITEERVRRFCEAIGVTYDGTVPPPLWAPCWEEPFRGWNCPCKV